MNYNIKKYFTFFFLLFSVFSFSQKDTTPVRGTIKIAKKQAEDVYIKAVADFNNYDLSKIKNEVLEAERFQPFPVVLGYPYPFSYSKYFINNFRHKEIDLREKMADTVVIEVKVLENGKVYIRDKSKCIVIKGTPVTYDEKVGGYEINNLHLNCLKFLKEINKWFPGYVVFPKKDKFRGEVVVKPKKKNVDVSGTITIYFSTTPFDD